MAHAILTKPAVKPAPHRVVRRHTHTAAAPAKAPELKHFIVDFARPRRGAALAAHTQAFLELSGIADGKAYPRAKAVQVIGATAVKWHTGNGNLSATTEGLKMTEKGYAFFSARSSVDPELRVAYIDVLSHGTLNPLANVTNALCIGVIK